MINVVVKGLDYYKTRVAQARKELKDMTVPNKRAALYLDRWVQDNFKTEGGKVGGWEPFKYGGRVTFKGIDTSAKLLQDTGVLRASFVPFWSRTSAGIGSDIPYSEKHEKGQEGLPVRRMLPEHGEVDEDIGKIYNDWSFKEVLNGGEL